MVSYFDELSNISRMGNYNVAPKLPAPVAQHNLTPTYNVNVQAPTTGGDYGSSGGGSSDLDRLMRAIKSQESSNNYGAVNHDSGALGGYQIMPFNLDPWSQEALGRSVSQSEFMSSPSIQDSIARYKLGQYLSKYGAAGAAAAWYGGPGAVAHMDDNNPQPGGYPSLRAYYEAILRRMN